LESLVNPEPFAGKSESKLISKQSWPGTNAFHLWHLSSLDAPSVAVVWSCALAWAAGIRLPLWAPLLLALVTWTVYIGDRLLDARAGQRVPAEHDLRERHYFHWRHRMVLTTCAIAAASSSAWMILTLLPAAARAPDSAVGAATLAYFSGVHARRRLPGVAHPWLALFFTKEFLVGVLFTAGCLLPTWSQGRSASGTGWLARIVLPAVFFTALAWLNCYAIARWESARPGMALKRVRRIACGLGSAGLVAAFFAAAAEPRVAALLAMGAASAFLLAMLEVVRERISALTLRAAADLVLLAPALLMVPSWWRA
jgi:hypothetical protein